jgi:phosphopantothenoylcysteine decarboxylase/phosphopantothenate--cysteine ligase
MRILVTAGPTREHFDTVRFLSNASSGKMGYAIAAAASGRGHEVVLISGPVTLAAPEGVELVRVTSAREMFEAAVARFEDCQAAIMAAAVCDYRPAQRAASKREKGGEPITVLLEPTKDICAHLGGRKGHRIVVGFAMEDHDHHRHAEAKLQRKQCDAVVLNGVDTVGADLANIEILRKGAGWSTPSRGSKAECAARLIELVESLVLQGG